MQGTGRVIFRDVQRREVVVLILYFRTRVHDETGMREDALHTAQRSRHGVQRASGMATACQRDIQAVRLQGGLNAFLFKHVLA